MPIPIGLIIIESHVTPADRSSSWTTPCSLGGAPRPPLPSGYWTMASPASHWALRNSTWPASVPTWAIRLRVRSRMSSSV